MTQCTAAEECRWTVNTVMCFSWASNCAINATNSGRAHLWPKFMWNMQTWHLDVQFAALKEDVEGDVLKYPHGLREVVLADELDDPLIFLLPQGIKLA